jgi:hypothetical protein
MSSSEDITTMDDPDLIAERRRVREALEHTPPGEISPELRQRFRRLDDEFVRRAQATWAGSQGELRATASDTNRTDEHRRKCDPRVTIHEFERTYLEKLRLAAQVILEAAPDWSLMPDPLEVELGIFKDHVEFMLLLPEAAAGELP